MSQKKSDIETYLLAEIKKSGFPLEIEVSETLEKMPFAVINTPYFFDEDLKLGRSIDIHAIPIHILHLEENLKPLSIRAELAIECKKSQTHALVLYTRPQMWYKAVFIDGQLHTTVPNVTEDVGSFENSIAEFIDLHYGSFTRIAIAYDEIKIAKLKNDGDSHRRDIFEGINQLVKFVCYESHESIKRRSKSNPESAEDLILFFYPVIVFDGELFEVKFNKSEPSISRTKHALLATHYRCPYCNKVERYMLDIVHRNYVEDYLRLVERSILKTAETLVEKRDALLSKAAKEKAKCKED